MLRIILSFFGALFATLVMGVALGALVVGAVFHIYGRDLPDHATLAQYTPATISRIYSGDGQIIDEFARERRLFVRSADIPDMVKAAFISAEDKNFYTHKGYDPRGMAIIALEALMTGGESLRGASTITQQLMKHFLLSSDVRLERKIKEIILASRIETALNKDQILELYLNEIFLGQNSYGVAAAAQSYFNKPLHELEPHEVAVLAAMPKKPSAFHPVREKESLLARRNFVLREMWENGHLDAETYQAEVVKELRTVQNGDFVRFRAQIPARDYFTDEIRRQLSRDFGEEQFFTAGLAVRATLDPQLQKVAARALRRALETYDRAQGLWRGTGQRLPEAALADESAWRTALAELALPRDIDLDGPWHVAVVLELGESAARIGIEGIPGESDGHYIPAQDVQWAHKRRADGGRGAKAQVAGDLLARGDVVFVRALLDDAGGFQRWSLRQIPQVQGAFMAMDVNTGRVLAMQGGFSYQHSVFNRATQAKRQPGSSFKPFVYAAALDRGYTPASMVVDAPIEVDTPEGLWRPRNSSDKFYGPVPLRTGIEQSRNLMTVRLAQEIGMETVAQYAQRFGVYEAMHPYLANALGAEETTLYDMVAAYAMFANGGERVRPTLVERIQDRYGQTLYRHDARLCLDCAHRDLAPAQGPRIVSDRQRVMDAVTAYQLTSMLQGVVSHGTARRVIDLPVPVAGKTGTTNDSKDAWFLGFTSSIAAGCYIGFDRPRPLGKHAYGSNMCGPVFQDFMVEAVKKYGGAAFHPPSGGYFINIDRYTGARLEGDSEGPNVVAEFFREGETPVFGLAYDGGFVMGETLLLVEEVEAAGAREVITSTGNRVVIEPKATFGTVTSGGLY